MIRDDFAEALERVAGPTPPETADIELLLRPQNPAEEELLFREAARMRDRRCGRRLVVRGLVEFSSYCGNSCLYCGLSRNNAKAERYSLGEADILACARNIAEAGVMTIVLQSGEDGTPAGKLASLIERIRGDYGLAVTLSLGERSRGEYALLKAAGADRYLLRVESTNAALYASLHEGRELATRLRCLDDLQELGYQTGSGMMVGLPGQGLADLAGDIRFLALRKFDMVGIGPFIPHPDTRLAREPAGDIGLTLRVIAVARLALKDSWLPATTAVGSLGADRRIDALKAGANVVMPNFSPESVKAKYAIYPGKRCLLESGQDPLEGIRRLAREAGLEVDLSRADSLHLDVRPLAAPVAEENEPAAHHLVYGHGEPGAEEAEAHDVDQGV